jgi:hypothetical protein
MTLVPPQFIKDFRKAQKQLVLDLSRPILIGLGNSLEEGCPNCFYDGYSGASGATFNTSFIAPTTLFAGTTSERIVNPTPFNRICPVCRGEGKLIVPNEESIMAHITWEVSITDTYPSAPPGDVGQHYVMIKADSKYYDDFVNADYFVVDGVRLETVEIPYIRSIKEADGIVEVLCGTVNATKSLKNG